MQRRHSDRCQSIKNYMKLIAFIIAIAIFVPSCRKDAAPVTVNPPLVSESFLPMHIGNYWKLGTLSSITIIDTLRFNNNFYYKFYSVIGGDAVAVRYLRIDNSNQLWEGYPSQPGKEYLHAKFDANVNDVFYTLNDQSVNDYKVTMSVKTDNTRSFEFDMVYHPTLQGQISKRTYLKGLGWGNDQWDSVRINGTVYRK